MSTIENEIHSDLESPHLFNYLREEVPVEDIRDYASPRRIRSIDFAKGFAITMVIVAHCSGSWLIPERSWLYGIGFAFLDVLGPGLFVFLSALSVVFSVKKKENILPDKVIRARSLFRGGMMMLIGAGYNVVFMMGSDIYFPATLWGLNILTLIGIAQIISYFALKLKKWQRALIGMIIVASSDYIRAFLYYGKETGNPVISLLNFILISPLPMTPIFPTLSVSFISTIFGEYLYDAMKKGTKDAYVGLFRIFLIWGALLIIWGLLSPTLIIGGSVLGYYPVAPGDLPGGLTEYPHLGLLYAINKNPWFTWEGMPLFLVRGTSSNMWYNLGASLLIIAIGFYIIDLKEKDNGFINTMNYFGKISLSLFFIHQIFIATFHQQLDIIFFVIVILSYIGMLGLGMYIWIEYAGGKGSPEWLIVQLGRIVMQPKKKRKK